MNQVVTIQDRAERKSLLAEMAGRYGMEPQIFADTLKATVVPRNASNEEFAAFLLVAREYDLNPITKEIYAFPKQGGGIQPIVSVDGWANLINSHPKADGFEFEDRLDDKGNLVAITCRIFRKDRAHAVEATEYMAECKRDTSTWRQWPRRMLRHKALIQAARYAFGFAGIVDEDEAERIAPAQSSPPPAPALTPPKAPDLEPPKPTHPEVAAMVESSAQRPPNAGEERVIALAQSLDTMAEGDPNEFWAAEIDPIYDALSPADQEFLDGKMREASQRLAP